MFPVNADRFFRELRSHRGTPTLDLSCTGYIDGQERQIRYTVRDGVKTLKLARPIVEKTDGAEHSYYRFSGDPEQVRQIMLGKLVAAINEGKAVTHEDGTPVTPESIDRLVKEQSVASDNLSILLKLDIDVAAMDRFFCKVALAAAYRELGEEFATSAVADKLRNCMEAKASEASGLPVIYIPHGTQTHAYFAISDAHLLGFLPYEMSPLVISLFGGQYAAIVTLDDSSLDGFRARPSGKLYRMDLSPKQLTVYSYAEYLAKHPWDSPQSS